MSDEMGRDKLQEISDKLAEQDFAGDGSIQDVSALREENRRLRKNLVELSYYLNMALNDLERRASVSTGERRKDSGLKSGFGPAAILRKLSRLPGIRRLREPRIVRTIRESGQFSPEFYRDTYADLEGYQGDLLLHFVRYGGYEGRSPNRFFDSKWYLNSNPVVGRKGINPLYHYLKTGSEEGLWPSPDYSPDEYRRLFDSE